MPRMPCPHGVDPPACMHGGENASDDVSVCLRLPCIWTLTLANGLACGPFVAVDPNSGTVLSWSETRCGPKVTRFFLRDACAARWQGACGSVNMSVATGRQQSCIRFYDLIADNETACRAPATFFQRILCAICPVRQPLLEHAPPAPRGKRAFAVCQQPLFRGPRAVMSCPRLQSIITSTFCAQRFLACHGNDRPKLAATPDGSPSATQARLARTPAI